MTGVPLSVGKRTPRRVPKEMGFSFHSIFFNDSDTYIDVPYDASLDLQENSLVVWYRPEGDIGGNNILLEKLSTADDGYRIHQVGGDFIYRIGDDVAKELIGAEITVETGEWYLAVGTWDGSDMKIYVNGDLENTRSIGAYTISNPAVDLWMGSQRPGGPTKVAYGRISEAAVYSRALTASEVEEIWLNYPDIPRNGLVSWWRMEEGKGTTVKDPIGGNDGTMNNFSDPYGWVRDKKWGLREHV